MPRTDADRSAALRALPSVDQLLRHDALSKLSKPAVTRVVRALVDELRAAALDGSMDAEAIGRRCAPAALVSEVTGRCEAMQRRRHERVYNATGIVLHTGIGRAPLAPAAIDAVTGAAGYAIVEVDPVSGQRDQREVAVAALLTGLTGAGGALIVNNNAAATTLMLAALTAGTEVVVSRGELVEIGGGFRVPDVMKRAGCEMVEVGATNKTHVRDFRDATTDSTKAYLKVHPSNFRIEGFASTPSVRELRDLADEAGGDVLVLDDLGSGLLTDHPLPGLVDEPRVSGSLAQGAHVTCFSGDKLLGGPQCGILVGEAELIARCRAHPLYRAMRCDKLTHAALEATLMLYRDADPLAAVPTLRMLSAEAEELRARAQALATLLGDFGAEVVASHSFAGSGANPAKPLPSFATALPGGDRECDLLRAAQPVGVFARVADGKVMLDARSLLLEDLDAVALAVRQALGD
ncbi:MAG: L-seryl-tRNA(Sec) selenium transferase [Planctomycetota bacterium]|nr:L-seryl-tRNA(Sec) selenium transferase [Planctomycetota bacterium]